VTIALKGNKVPKIIFTVEHRFWPNTVRQLAATSDVSKSHCLKIPPNGSLHV